MTSIDFAAAQQRVAERRQRQQNASQARLESRQNSRASNALQGLPSPLKSIGQRGLATWDVIRGREGTRPAFRVGQVDAELLDEELLELLRGQVGEGLKYFGVWPPVAIEAQDASSQTVATYQRRLVSRDSIDAASCPIQARFLGPQRLLRRCPPKPSLHRCST